MGITILDGGLGQELVRRAGRATPLWSMQALIDAPDLVRQVHADFFTAGADVATTNTYAVLPDRLEAFGMPERLQDLTEIACTVAAEARDAAGRGTIAGSIGPLGFSYQPDNAPAPEQAADIYADVAACQAQFVDVFLIETMSSVAQAEGALMGLSAQSKPVWIAFSVDDTDGTRLRSGERIDQIAPLLETYQPERVLLNCSRPEAVSQGLPLLAKLHASVGAYANGFIKIEAQFNKIGATTDLLQTRKDIDPVTYAEFAQDWAGMGANTIGGCCEISPAHIAELARRLKLPLSAEDMPAA